MERHDLLYRLYDEFDTDGLREYQEFVDVFPVVDSRVALESWRAASEELERRKDAIRREFAAGETLAEVAARVTREGAFAALDLEASYGRAVNVLVLDVDGTLRTAGGTDNEIPRDTLHALTEFHDAGVPIVICTGQTVENVKGFAVQGLGSAVVHSGRFSIVYESGAGVFTPGHGAETKALLYEELDPAVRGIFEDVRSRLLREAGPELRRGCHLQGNEFNVTVKPNDRIGTPRSREIVEAALVALIDLLADATAATTGVDRAAAVPIARRFYADRDPAIRGVLERRGAYPVDPPTASPDGLAALLERIDVAYHEADAAEIASLELDKVAGVERALSVLGVDDPFALVMGDSRSDLRVMEWAAENDAGIAAAPDHAAEEVIEHVLGTDGLVFDRGRSVGILRTVYAMNRFASLDSGLGDG